MNIDDITKIHPSIDSANDVVEVCRPLEKMLGIDYFAHVNVDPKGNFTALGRHPTYVEHYLKKGYYNIDIHLSKNEIKEEYVVHDAVPHYGITDELFRCSKNFGIHHVFTILQRNVESVDAFHFATSKINHQMNEIYLSNLSLLKMFILHFKEKAKADKGLVKAYEIKFKVDPQAEGYNAGMQPHPSELITNECADLSQIEKFYLPTCIDGAYLTKRELECLIWLHRGKTADEIGILMNITERTVRAHINSIKEKFGCYTLFQVGEKLVESGLGDIMNSSSKSSTLL